MKKSVTMNVEKVTKNTVRFAEKLESALDTPVIGTLYVPKATLKEIGYADGKSITVTVDVC